MSGPAADGACAVLIPAYDEAERVATVVRVALEANLGPVLVVDDGSGDATAERARDAGAEVLRLDRNRGKGAAVAAGVHARTEPVLVLLDADLTGLRPDHVRALAAPLLAGRCDMTRGVFAEGRTATTLAQTLAPVLGGQRGVRRELIASIEGLGEARFGLEVRLERAARRGGWRREDVRLDGVGQVMKEEKRGWWAGVRARLAMYRDVLRAWWTRG
jgi:glycosyltransferase involved in cell wall biosynthesis